MQERIYTIEQPVEKSELHARIQAASKPEFRALLVDMQENVSIGDLLEDRKAQARLDVLLGMFADRSERGIDRDFDKRMEASRWGKNPPLITLLDESGRMLSVQKCRFRLVDRKHLYYFDQQRPDEDMPSYLRPEDVIAVEEYTDWRIHVTEPFNKPINRVAMEGGSAEHYNYNTQQWEENRQGFFAGIHSRNKHHNSSFV